MKVDGQCLCGYLTYEAEVDPGFVAMCHCTDCQRGSGSAFSVVVAIKDEKFRLLSGEFKIYNKTAENGTIRAQSFCPECGTRILGKTVGEGPASFYLRAGTTNQRHEFKPGVQIWCRSAQNWVNDLGTIPSHAKQPASVSVE